TQPGYERSTRKHLGVIGDLRSGLTVSLFRRTRRVVGQVAIANGRERRTQAERSATTRARLLDATIACLHDLGYAGTSTPEIARRAGLSRGAQLHHFPTKAELVTSAVEHLFLRRRDEFLQAFHDRAAGQAPAAA